MSNAEYLRDAWSEIAWTYWAIRSRHCVETIYGLKPWWRALCKWCVAGNEALALKTLKAFPRAIWFSLRTKSWEGTLWI